MVHPQAGFPTGFLCGSRGAGSNFRQVEQLPAKTSTGIFRGLPIFLAGFPLDVLVLVLVLVRGHGKAGARRGVG
ncbi:hypothetical protein BZA05DRAFT_473605 [Tricharina praecox]|uniref:uncharacterized protein n=1 Tax=Tricharina praecox TaxID=43433 RepID=UPI00221E84DB|nr:uncharacterized protein BZA05DRAFT_473605 [Tricharina praecox]KAI5853564.1 hypothetical protein BZA05DRAFT_473605 [Tricharina praecox]